MENKKDKNNIYRKIQKRGGEEGIKVQLFGQRLPTFTVRIL